jgi:hypothetical protein
VDVLAHVQFTLMELTYSLTPDDLRQFNKLVRARDAKRLAATRRVLIVFSLAMVVLTILVLESLTRIGIIDVRANMAACLGLIWGVWIMMLGGWLWRRQLRASSPDGDSAAEELRLTIDGDGLQCASQTTTATYSWRAFTGMSEHTDLVVFWIDRKQGVLVPARALASEEARRKLVDFAHEHVAPAAPSSAQT